MVIWLETFNESALFVLVLLCYATLILVYDIVSWAQPYDENLA